MLTEAIIYRVWLLKTGRLVGWSCKLVRHGCILQQLGSYLVYYIRGVVAMVLQWVLIRISSSSYDFYLCVLLRLESLSYSRTNLLVGCNR